MCFTFYRLQRRTYYTEGKWIRILLISIFNNRWKFQDFFCSEKKFLQYQVTFLNVWCHWIFIEMFAISLLCNHNGRDPYLINSWLTKDTSLLIFSGRIMTATRCKLGPISLNVLHLVSTRERTKSFLPTSRALLNCYDLMWHVFLSICMPDSRLPKCYIQAEPRKKKRPSEVALGQLCGLH